MTTPATTGRYFYGTGRRKEATARVRLYPGDGAIVVNGKPMEEIWVELLGGNPGAPIDEVGEYDRLYVVRIDAAGAVSTELRRYGAPYEGR